MVDDSMLSVPNDHWFYKIVSIALLSIWLSSCTVFIQSVQSKPLPDGCNNRPEGTATADCESPVLAGGFPIAYLFDAQGVSVIGTLGVEDDVHRRFYWNSSVYGVPLTVAVLLISRHKRLNYLAIALIAPLLIASTWAIWIYTLL